MRELALKEYNKCYTYHNFRLVASSKNAGVPIYTARWRQALCESSVLPTKTQHNGPEQAWTQPLGHCAIREDWRSIFKSLKMLPVFWFSSPFQDVLPRLLGTVHSDDEEVFPSSQGRQSLRLAVDKESWHKRLGSGSNTPYPRRQGLFCSVFFFFQIQMVLRLNSQKKHKKSSWSIFYKACFASNEIKTPYLKDFDIFIFLFHHIACHLIKKKFHTL